MNTCHSPTETITSGDASDVIKRPQFQIKESDTGTQVLVALPGVRKEDLKLTLQERSLQIEAVRDQEIPEVWKTHRDLEPIRRYGLTLRLAPKLDGSRTTAIFEAGVLTLQIPLSELAKSRQIHVN